MPILNTEKSRLINRMLCVPVMLLFILGLHLMKIPDPAVILMIPVVYFVYSDGYIGGTLSGLCVIGYLVFLSQFPHTNSPDTYVNLRVIITVAIALASIIILVGKLKERSARIIEARQSIVNELATINKELDEAVERAESANQEKSRFLSRVSHDIRTPLNVILGSTNLAITELQNPQELEKYLENIRTAGTFLLGLINDVLDISKIESGKMNFDPSPYSYSEFANSLRMMFEPLCQEKNISFIINVDDILPTIYTDKVRFEQIFFNLISNAIKFTPEHGTVAFSIQVIEQTKDVLTCEFRVSDTGVGMSDEFQNHMFDPFSQETGHDLSSNKGTGLGLPIVKRVVDSMKGTLTVLSDAGEGTTFTVVLSLPIVDDEEALKTGGRRILNWSILKDRNVLVAEDYPLNMVIIQKLLENKGMIVTQANDGNEALEAFKASEIGHFDVILLDVRMPNMNGFEAAKAIRTLDRLDAKTIPIAAMTADVFDSEIQESVQSGMNEYLTKPIDTAILYDTLTELITWE